MIELQVVLNFILDTFNIEVNENDIPDDTWFDTIEHEGKVCWLSKKFIPKVFTAKNKTGGDQSRYKRRQKKLKRFNRVIPEQFRFHYDSTLVKKVPLLYNLLIIFIFPRSYMGQVRFFLTFYVSSS